MDKPIKDTKAEVSSSKLDGRLNPTFEGDENPNLNEKLPPSDTIEESSLTNSTLSKAETHVVKLEGEARGQWSNQWEFLFSCIAMSVGIGNFYRFPFVAYKNGGGAFIIPYLIVLFFIGKPVYFLELSLGQFCSYGQVKCWKLAPFFKGVGYASTLASFCVVSYYVSVMALTVFYFFASFQKTLPWANCDASWAGEEICAMNKSEHIINNISLPQLYFDNEVLKQKPNVDDGIGAPEWRLTLCYLFSWIAVFLSIVKGVQSSGKVAYFTALYPYLMLTVLLIFGAVQPGAADGMWYFIKPNWAKMYDPKVWYAAVSQCFFSLSTGFGPIVMYASYNPFRHNVYKDALIVSLADTFTSLFAGITVFSILGNLAHEMNVPVGEVAKSGPGLVFVSYADSISKVEYVPQLLAVLFYLMLFALGVGSAVSWQMAVITVVCDQFPKLPKFWVTAVLCAICFLLGLIYVTPGGQFMLTLVDNFGGNFVIYVLATLEVMGISWVYGLNNICRDFGFMLNMKISWFWKFCWGFFVPLTLIVIFFYSLAVEKTLTHNDIPYPTSAIACGWLLAAVCLGFVPAFAIHSILTSEGDTYLEKLKASFRPKADWGPKDPNDRKEWEKMKNPSSTALKEPLQFPYTEGG